MARAGCQGWEERARRGCFLAGTARFIKVVFNKNRIIPAIVARIQQFPDRFHKLTLPILKLPFHRKRPSPARSEQTRVTETAATPRVTRDCCLRRAGAPHEGSVRPLQTLLGSRGPARLGGVGPGADPRM